MVTFTAQPQVGAAEAPSKFIVVGQDTGRFNLLKLSHGEPEPVSDGFFNQLSMIYKLIMLPNVVDDATYNFVVGTNNGIAFLNINKSTFAMSVTREHYLTGKVVNNLLIRGQKIIAFEHNQQKFHLIDRKSQEVINMNWLQSQEICCTGLEWVPDYHPTELSFIWVRGTNGVHLLNTQTWHITTLISIAEGSASYPDLSMLAVTASDDHKLEVFTVNKKDKLLVKRSYSYMLKYCLQTASIRASNSKPDALRRRLE